MVNVLLIFFCQPHESLALIRLNVFAETLYFRAFGLLRETFGVFVLEWEREIGLSSEGMPHYYTDKIN